MNVQHNFQIPQDRWIHLTSAHSTLLFPSTPTAMEKEGDGVCYSRHRSIPLSSSAAPTRAWQKGRRRPPCTSSGSQNSSEEDPNSIARAALTACPGESHKPLLLSCRSPLAPPPSPAGGETAGRGGERSRAGSDGSQGERGRRRDEAMKERKEMSPAFSCG